MKVSSVLLIISFFLTSCSTQLTRNGSRIVAVNNSNSNIANDCERLGTVRGQAQAGWGNDVGINQAYNDALNKAGEIEDADTMVVANVNRQFSGGTVTGVVYNCKKQRVQLIKNISEKNDLNQNEIIKKAKKCQEKGGVWINNICQLDI